MVTSPRGRSSPTPPQIEFRYRIPRLLGMPSNGRQAYATLSSDLVTPMMLYGAQQGDLYEMWRNPEGPDDEFLCRVVRVDAAGVLKALRRRGQ
jgi:hypothetical protein